MKALSTVSFLLLLGESVTALRLQLPDIKPSNDLPREISFLRRRYEQAEGLLSLTTPPSSSSSGEYEMDGHTLRAIRLLDANMRHWADLESRVRAAATGEKGQPTKLFEEALMLVARTRASLGQAYAESQEPLMALKELEIACPNLWDLQWLAESPFHRVLCRWFCFLWQRLKRQGPIPHASSLAALHQAPPVTGLLSLYPLSLHGSEGWLSCYATLSELYLSQIPFEEVSSLEAAELNPKLPWLSSDRDPDTTTVSEHALKLQTLAMISQLTTLSPEALQQMAGSGKLIWNEAMSMRSRLRDATKHFIIAQSHEEQHVLYEKCQLVLQAVEAAIRRLLTTQLAAIASQSLENPANVATTGESNNSALGMDDEPGASVVAEIQALVEAVMREGKHYQSIMRGVMRYGWSYLESEYERVLSQGQHVAVPEGFHSRADILLSFQQLRAQYLAHTGGQEPASTSSHPSWSSTPTDSSSSGHWFTQMVLLVLAALVVLTSVTSLKSTKPRSRLRPATAASATRRQRPFRSGRSFLSALWERIRQPSYLENLCGSPRMLANAMMASGKTLCSVPTHLMNYIRFDAVSSAEKVQAELLRQEEEERRAATTVAALSNNATSRDATKKPRVRLEKKGSSESVGKESSKARETSPAPVASPTRIAPPAPAPSTISPSVKATATQPRKRASSVCQVTMPNEKENIGVVIESSRPKARRVDVVDLPRPKVLVDASNVNKVVEMSQEVTPTTTIGASVVEERQQKQEEEEMGMKMVVEETAVFEKDDSEPAAASMFVPTNAAQEPALTVETPAISYEPGCLKASEISSPATEDSTESSGSSNPATPDRSSADAIAPIPPNNAPEPPAAARPANRIERSSSLPLPETQRRTKTRPRPTTVTSTASNSIPVESERVKAKQPEILFIPAAAATPTQRPKQHPMQQAPRQQHMSRGSTPPPPEEQLLQQHEVANPQVPIDSAPRRGRRILRTQQPPPPFVAPVNVGPLHLAMIPPLTPPPMAHTYPHPHPPPVLYPSPTLSPHPDMAWNVSSSPVNVTTDMTPRGGNPTFAPPPPPPPPFPPSTPPSMIKDQILASLQRQIEYYFSVENLCKDLYLRRKMDPEGWVLLSEIANFNRVRCLTTDIRLVAASISQSQLVELQMPWSVKASQADLCECSPQALLACRVRTADRPERWVMTTLNHPVSL